MSVSVIIPTTCELRRKESLARAIHSVVLQDVGEVEVIVVVNGERFDPELFAQLKADARLKVHYQHEASLPAALRYGRTLVSREFFSFLDDDDEYFPDALRVRLTPMLHDAAVDVVVTNGYMMEAGAWQLRVRHPHAVNREPLEALIKENWLASCGGLFRSSTITPDYFDGHTKYFEWTLLAFRLVLAKRKIIFLEAPTYRINETAQSLSKSREYHQSAIGFIHYLMTLDTSPRVRKALEYKLAAAWHGASEDYLNAGERTRAWRCHVKSLLHPGGLKYLGYSWRFFQPRRAARKAGPLDRTDQRIS